MFVLSRLIFFRIRILVDSLGVGLGLVNSPSLYMICSIYRSPKDPLLCLLDESLDVGLGFVSFGWDRSIHRYRCRYCYHYRCPTNFPAAFLYSLNSFNTNDHNQHYFFNGCLDLDLGLAIFVPLSLYMSFPHLSHWALPLLSPRS